MKTEAWWVCHICGKPTIKKGKPHVKQAMLEHRKSCDKHACFAVKQIDQVTKKIAGV